MFSYKSRVRVGLTMGFVCLLSGALFASKVLHMNLASLTNNAGAIFRGTLTDVQHGVISVGGAELPTTTYRFLVSEDFKGQSTTTKANVRTIEMKVIGTTKHQHTVVNGQRKLSVLPEPPNMVTGGDYLVFATSPSAVGLCTTVGLNQGFFRIYNKNKQEYAENGLNNAGLFRNMATSAQQQTEGAIEYNVLASEIRSLLGGQ